MTAIVGIMYAMTLATAQTSQKPDVIKATRFVLVDDEGRERVVIGFNGQSVGLYIHARTPKEGIGPLVVLESAPIKSAPIDEKAEEASLRILNEITPTVANITANSIGLWDVKKDESIRLSYLNSPALKFTDQSGMPYIYLARSDKVGVEFEMRSPLGIKDAYNDAMRAHLDGKDGDLKIEETWQRSLRFRCVAPPFSPPGISLWHDGHVIWNAKGE